MVARCFADFRISRLIERTANTRTENETPLIEIKNCLMAAFDIKESIMAYEKLINSCTHIFTSETISALYLCSVPLDKRVILVSLNSTSNYAL